MIEPTLTKQPVAEGIRSRFWHRFATGHVALGLAIVSWCFLMEPLLTAGPLVLDEHGSYWILDSDLPGNALERSLNYAAIPPLSSWLQQLFLSIFGKTEFVFRLPSALCALGAILVTYQAAKEMGNRTTGGIAALLIAWHPEAMDEVRIARCYGLVLLLGALLLLLTIRWQRRPSSSRLAIAWGGAASALLWTHYTSALLVMLSGLTVAATIIWKRQWTTEKFLRLLTGSGILVLLCLPLVPSILRLQEWGPMLNFSPGGVSIDQVIGPFWWAGLPAGLLLTLPCGWRRPRSERTGPAWGLLIVCSLVPLLFLAYLASGEMSSLANPRYRVAYAPAGACLVALFFTWREQYFVSLLATLLLLSIAWSYSPSSPRQLGRLGQATARDWRELNQYLIDNSEPEQTIFVQSGLTEGYLVPAFAKDRQFMEYVACRVGRFYVETPHPRYALPFLWQPQTGVKEFYEDLLRSLPDEPKGFWVACATDTDLNRNSLVGIQEIAAAVGYTVKEVRFWPSATLVKYQLLEDHPR